MTIKRTHGMTRVGGWKGPISPTYLSWQRMKSRCLNPNAPDYPRYGGRGILICDRWKHSFEAFFSDMGERPERMQLDRIDNNGNYEPSNCRWISKKGNANNRSTTTKFTINGITRTASEWGDVTGLGRTFYDRIRRGWTPERAAETPKESK